MNFISFKESKFEYISWLQKHVSKQLFGIEQDMMIASVYIPLWQSKFYNDDELEIFEQEISSACCNFDYLYMLGDFNAQTGELSDYTTADSFLSEFFDFDQDTIDSYNQKCVLENFGIQLQKNNHGFKSIDICKNNNLILLNGRYGQDKNVDELTFRELSVIDYAITSSKGVEFLQIFALQKSTDCSRTDMHYCHFKSKL